MRKRKDIDELTNLMSKALRHKIGSIVNKDEIYVGKYAKDSENIMKEAEKVLLRHKWNNYDRSKIKSQLSIKLKKELEQKDFIENKKFDIMESEIEIALNNFKLR